MPKLTNQELKNLKYVSMSDFYNRVKTYENMNDKLRFATQYLLLHGTGKGEPDYSIEEATYIAQLAISEASAEAKRNTLNKEFLKKNPQIVNPSIKTAQEDLPFELFMNDPYHYLAGHARKNIKQIDDLDAELPQDRLLKQNCQNLLEDKLDEVNFTDDVHELAQKANHVGVKLRTEAKLGGKEQLEALYKATQPGFFSKMFGTSSVAAKNLDAAYKAFNNPNHALYGNKEAMRKASIEYLQYKFPGWKPGDAYPEIDGNRALDATEKARSKLSATLLDTLEEQHRSEEPLKDIIDAVKDQEITFQAADRQMANQKEFQHKISIDIDDSVSDLDVSIDEIPAPQKEVEKEKEDDKLNVDELMKNIEIDK